MIYMERVSLVNRGRLIYNLHTDDGGFHIQLFFSYFKVPDLYHFSPGYYF